MSASDPHLRWRSHGMVVATLSVVLLATAVMVPWFARITDLPADDDHMEELTAWMNGQAIGDAGAGWADVLRVVPWGIALLIVSIVGFWAGIRARRAPGRDRTVARAAVWSAAAGFAVTGLAWVGAAYGADTRVVPHLGLLIAVFVLVGWLVTGVAMLRLSRAASAVPMPSAEHE